MATSDLKMDEITTASRELAAQQSHENVDFDMEDSVSRFELRVLKHGELCINQSFSKTHCTSPQRRS